MRERSRRSRLRRVAYALGVATAVLWFRVLTGHPLGVGLPHLPSGLSSFLPALVLICLLGSVLVIPMIAAGRSPHVLYRAADIEVSLADVKGAGVVVDE